ncbi:orotidine-5'-phosphate decarboxylase [Synchytrium microbalum]|uniref:Orotidine 5'-phosphate decarboxylase n=1 Tax=Synchytrium microbalum TaxID=1806994 RepID=A0A507C1C9_9FUNG|nr:orotidine-5'-phosphate decarboxylase [Synchytrium microbalum]TPX33502.1 orotidine-5'-phosphate decarboxylase [Synchytrium microbalum]
MASKTALKRSYADRASSHTNPLSKRLLTLMDDKRTNLCIAADVTTKKELLQLADAAGPGICILKTHIDIIQDFDASLITELTELATKHNFLIFEDRKFADIGNTSHLQFTSGIYRISQWAHLITAHAVPGPGILTGLSQSNSTTGCLLLAEMSPVGTLATGHYTRQAIAMAHKFPDFVVGFIAMSRYDGIIEELKASKEVEENVGSDFLYMTPGVDLAAGGDKMGQVYKTPRNVIVERGSDVIIVGRGIYAGAGGGMADVETIGKRVEQFRKAGWDAYVERTASL